MCPKCSYCVFACGVPKPENINVYTNERYTTSNVCIYFFPIIYYTLKRKKTIKIIIHSSVCVRIFNSVCLIRGKIIVFFFFPKFVLRSRVYPSL